MKEKLIRAYKQSKDVVASCNAADVDVWLGQVILIQEGLITVESNDISIKRGAMAERKFQEIFPEATNANHKKHNNPGFDFNYNNLLIEVKYASIAKDKKEIWKFRIRKQKKADFFAVFLDYSKSCDLSKYDLLLIPGSTINHLTSPAVTKASEYYKRFKITPCKIKFHLDKLIEFYETGKRI